MTQEGSKLERRGAQRLSPARGQERELQPGHLWGPRYSAEKTGAGVTLSMGRDNTAMIHGVCPSPTLCCLQ